MALTNKSAAARWLANAPVATAFKVPATRKAWEKKRVEVREQLWQLLGRLPPRPKIPRVEILSRTERGDYVLEKFQFDNGAGATVPGYLLLPSTVDRIRKSAAILYCHWHAGEYDKGKEELFHKKHTPLEPGPTLARRGYVVMAIDAYGFGERSGRGPGGPGERGAQEEMSASKFNLWVGRTLWGMILRDDLMALDILVSRPEVDRNRVGVTGMSMGATRSWWLMALDERIKTSVAVACLTRYQNLIRHQGLARHAIYYFVPGMLNYFDSEAVVALSAPRPMLFLTGDKDAGSPVDGVRTIESTVRKVYKLYGQENQFESVIYRGVGHEYTPNMWERMLKWMDKHLKEMTNDETRRKVRLATSGENLFTVQRGLERSADFQSAVSPNCIRQGVGLVPHDGVSQRFAECYSAIQESATLRYGGTILLRGLSDARWVRFRRPQCWSVGTRSIRGWITLLCALFVWSLTVSAPSTDPVDSTFWPNQASHANGDRWLVEHHDQMRRMNPRLLVLNFDNHALREELDVLVDKIIAGIAEGSRYHGYKDSKAPVFLQYSVFKFVDFRETNAPKLELNSRLFPLKPDVTNSFNVDHNRFFSDDFARHYGVPNPQKGESFLRLDELVDHGYVHEVWIITNGDESRIKAFECVELKPRYNERFERVGGEYVQAGNGGDPEQKWTGRSVRLGFVNSTRGSGCFLESLSHSIEGISTSGAIPYLTRYFAEFAGYDLDKRWNLPFDSLYALAYEGKIVGFPDNHTAVIKAPKGDSIVVSNYFAIGGNAHWPPNARGHYDMDNTNAVLSTIEDWRIGSGPGGKEMKSPWTNAAFDRYRELAPDCMGAWLVYWRQNFPGLDNKQKDDHGKPMKNWWPFLFY